MPLSRRLLASCLAISMISACAPSLPRNEPTALETAKVAASSTGAAASDIATAAGTAARGVARGVRQGAETARDLPALMRMPRMQIGTLLPYGGAIEPEGTPWDVSEVREWMVKVPEGTFIVRQASRRMPPGHDVMVVREDMRLLLIP